MIAVGAGKILVLYNNEYSDELMKVGITHEYHHSIWTERHLGEEDSPTVLDTLIFEGKAVMFEEIVYPDSDISIINSSYIRTFWEKIESDLNKVDMNRTMEILYGDERLPYLHGYSEGDKMVKSYLDKNPDLTPGE